MPDPDARSRARKIVEQRNLTGFANDTKWGEFFAEISRLKIQLELKYLGEDEPTRKTIVWSPARNCIESFQFGPYLYAFVEWVKSDEIETVTRLAKTVGLEYVVRDSKITVYGYR